MLNNLRELCEHYQVSREDFATAVSIVGCAYRQADLVIAPDGNPYLYRWHVIPHNKQANVYFHLQVADDPERPLHDHPWHNTSVILAGGYTEIMSLAEDDPTDGLVWTFHRGKGAVVNRAAEDAHRLLMSDGVRYTMTLFSTGPKIRKWGFWYPEGWVDADAVCRLDGNTSVHVKGM